MTFGRSARPAYGALACAVALSFVGQANAQKGDAFGPDPNRPLTVLEDDPTPEEQVNRAREERPRFQVLRYDEDPRPLRDEAARGEFPALLRYIPIGADGSFLSIGGEARLRPQYIENEDWGDGRDADGEFQGRYSLFADLRLGEHVRFFADLEGAHTDGRQGARVTEVDEAGIDFHQVFVDVTLPFAGSGVAVRAGRQEVALGEQRLVGVRIGANIRRSFDGLRLFADAGRWQLGALALRPVEDAAGAFNDPTYKSELLYGGYAIRPFALGSGQGRLGLLYLGSERENVRFDAPLVADERRHSVALRFAGEVGLMSFDAEAIGQFGSFGGQDIRAWQVGADAVYHPKGMTFGPALGVRFNVASGDDDPADGELGTFNALYARAPTLNAELATPNLVTFGPTLGLAPVPAVSLGLSYEWLSRTNRNDGVYRGANSLLRTGRTLREREVGSRLIATATWRVSPFISADVYVNYFWAGDLLEEITPGHDQLYVGSFITLRF